MLQWKAVYLKKKNPSGKKDESWLSNHSLGLPDKTRGVSLHLPLPQGRGQRGRHLQSAHKCLLAIEKRSCRKLNLMEVGHIPRGASDIVGGITNKLTGLGSCRGQICLQKRRVYEGLPSRLERVGEHAERLVSMPSEV